MKLTKKDLESLVLFNKNQKRIGEPKMSPEQYLRYLYGKTEKVVQGKPNKLKALELPSWAVTHDHIKSVTSDHIATKANEEYKKEVSKKYPVALAYNKGNYQVLLPSEIQHAGRKV